MNRPLKRTFPPAGLLLGALLLTACGDDGTSRDTTSRGGSASSSPSAAAQLNDVDVSFSQGMIPHHQQAVEMSQLAADRAQSTEVEQLAADIEAAQAPEIEQLTTWLERWGEEVPTADMEHGDMSRMEHGSDGFGEMSGMMDDDDMAMLEEASGAEFDQMFLEMMVEHHQGAVTMAQSEVEGGANQDAIEMAEDIIEKQNDEIEQMQQLLEKS